MNVLNYDPRDHFDFAYVPEGWKRVQKRLASGSIADFGLATHAIGDFYAHSFYAHCVPPGSDGLLPIYDPAAPPDLSSVAYDFANLPLPECAQSSQDAADLWQGRLDQRSVVALVRGLPPRASDADAVGTAPLPARP